MPGALVFCRHCCGGERIRFCLCFFLCLCLCLCLSVSASASASASVAVNNVRVRMASAVHSEDELVRPLQSSSRDLVPREEAGLHQLRIAVPGHGRDGGRVADDLPALSAAVGVRGDVDRLQGDNHLHEAVGVVLAAGHRRLLRGHATSTTGDHPSGLAHVPAGTEVTVVDALLVGVPRDVEVHAHGLEELGPVHVGIRRVAQGESCRVVVHQDLPLRVRLWQCFLEPDVVRLPQILEPAHALAGVVRSRGSTVSTIARVDIEFAVDTRVALRRADVVARDSPRRRVVDVAVKEEKVDLEALVLHATAPVLCRQQPLVVMPSVEDLLVPALDVANPAVIVVSQYTPPLKLRQLPGVHVPPDLLELDGHGRLVGQAAVVIDATRVEVVPDVDDEPGRGTVLHQLLLAAQHAVADEALRDAVNLLDAGRAVGHGTGLALIPALRPTDADGGLRAVVALVVLAPTADTAPIANREEVGHTLVDAERWPLDAVVRHRVGREPGFWLRLETRAVKDAGELRTLGTGVQRVVARACLAGCHLARPEAAAAVATLHHGWAFNRARRRARRRRRAGAVSVTTTANEDD
mmetsp:Transcript_17692/g.56624  ORF Transcript_17692/g.56624 Transcript_17692/m.56624 type:complete len:580 (+) Transcript_17692:81-1820(+)